MAVVKIGPISIESPIALSPMEDVTDYPFRVICKRLGADLLYTEFTSSEALIRDVPKALNKIKITAEERPIAIQIFGGVETSMEKAASVVESFGPDFIDINCGCWVKNHVRRGEGAGLLKDLKHFEKIVKSTIKGTSLPVTVKTRLGWDANNIVILDVAKMLQDAGVAALAVHCRTRTQGHKGEADWTWLEKLKKAVQIPIIGNGDVKDPQDVKRMLETGCDGVMIGRAAIANPWIFQQAKHYLRTGQLPDPVSLEERINLCVEHLRLSYACNGPWEGIVGFRKYYAGYLKGVPNVAKLRADIMELMDVERIVERLYEFLEQNSRIPVCP